jgi:hypothetical protein
MTDDKLTGMIPRIEAGHITHIASKLAMSRDSADFGMSGV